jgi:hypothetical protein
MAYTSGWLACKCHMGSKGGTQAAKPGSNQQLGEAKHSQPSQPHCMAAHSKANQLF